MLLRPNVLQGPGVLRTRAERHAPPPFARCLCSAQNSNQPPMTRPLARVARVGALAMKVGESTRSVWLPANLARLSRFATREPRWSEMRSRARGSELSAKTVRVSHALCVTNARLCIIILLATAGLLNLVNSLSPQRPRTLGTIASCSLASPLLIPLR